MSQKPSPEEVVAAIQASGYFMEQEVATTLEQLGMHVQTNRAFQDIEEQKSREIDVWAFRTAHNDEVNGVSVFTELICECKNTQSPFAFLLRPKNKADNAITPQEYDFSPRAYRVPVDGKTNAYREVPAFKHLKLADNHYRYSSTNKAVQFAKIVKDKNSWSANHGGLYDAIFYPLVKAVLARKKETESRGDSPAYIWLRFPIVVTSGPLYVIDTSSETPTASPVRDTCFTRHMKAEKIDGYFSIDFVTQQGLTSFLEEKVNPFIDSVVMLAKENPELFGRGKQRV